MGKQIYVDQKIPYESVSYGNFENIGVKLTSTSSSVIKWCGKPSKEATLEEVLFKETPIALSVGSCKGRGLIEVSHKNKVTSFISCFHIISVLIIIVFVVVLTLIMSMSYIEVFFETCVKFIQQFCIL